MKKTIEFINKNKRIIISLIIIFAISLVFPFSGDDWLWKTQTLQTIKNFATDPILNGRYLGNTVIILMAENRILRGLFMSIVLTFIVEIIARESKSKITFIWAIILCMPIVIFRESIPWASGFANYAISTLFLLIDIYLIRKIYDNKYSMLKILGSSVIFYASCLFVENITVFLMIAIIILNIMYIINNKRINKGLLFTFVGTLLGFLTMFMHPVYSNIADGADTYRSFGSGISGIINCITNNFSSIIYKHMIFDSIIIMILVTGLMLIYYIKNNRKLKRPIVNLLFVYQILFISYAIIYHWSINWQILLSYTEYFNTIISIIYCFVLIATACLIYKKQEKKIILPYFIVIIGIIAPLCVVTPIGGRNFFSVYILETLIVCNLYKFANLKYDDIINKISTIVLLVLVTYFLSIYAYVYRIEDRRLNYIKEQSSLGNKVIKVPDLPYGAYIHTYGNFKSDYLSTVYKLSHGLDKDINFIYLPYDQWVIEIKK